MDITSILEKVDSEMFGIWFLIGAALVFFMQCGFAMVETGFTRAKNAGNIHIFNGQGKPRAQGCRIDPLRL